MVTTTACQARRVPDRQKIRAKRREIAVRYAWRAEQHSAKLSKTRLLTLLRLRELERLYAARGCLVDDDAGREYLEIVAHHIAHLGGVIESHVVGWCAIWAPWLPSAQATDLAKRVAAEPRKWNAVSLGNDVSLTPSERETLGITTFRPAGWTRKQLKKAAKTRRKNRDRQRNERAAIKEGRILRERAGRPRKTTLPTWTKLGMSRATWFRRGKPEMDETNILTTQDSYKCVRKYSSQAQPSATDRFEVENDFAPVSVLPMREAPSRNVITAAQCGFR